MSTRPILSYAHFDSQGSPRRTWWWIVGSVLLGGLFMFLAYCYSVTKPSSIRMGYVPKPRYSESSSSLYLLQGKALAETAARKEIVYWHDKHVAPGNRTGELESVAPWFAFISTPNVMNLDDLDDHIVYVGMHHAPDAADRIVVVRINHWPTSFEHAGKVSLSLQCIVMTPATPELEPRRMGRMQRADQIAVFQTPLVENRSLYIGLSDLADPAMFSFKFEHGVSTSILHGRLTAEDTVTWSIDPGGSATLIQDSNAPQRQ